MLPYSKIKEEQADVGNPDAPNGIFMLVKIITDPIMETVKHELIFEIEDEIVVIV